MGGGGTFWWGGFGEDTGGAPLKGVPPLIPPTILIAAILFPYWIYGHGRHLVSPPPSSFCFSAILFPYWISGCHRFLSPIDLGPQPPSCFPHHHPHNYHLVPPPTFTPWPPSCFPHLHPHSCHFVSPISTPTDAILFPPLPTSGHHLVPPSPPLPPRAPFCFPHLHPHGHHLVSPTSNLWPPSCSSPTSTPTSTPPGRHLVPLLCSRPRPPSFPPLVFTAPATILSPPCVHGPGRHLFPPPGRGPALRARGAAQSRHRSDQASGGADGG